MSEKRQRQGQIVVRVLPAERKLIEDAADADGLSVAAFVRAAALGIARQVLR